jgi:hypothetical protein
MRNSVSSTATAQSLILAGMHLTHLRICHHPAGNCTFAEVPGDAEIRQSYHVAASGHYSVAVVPPGHLLYKLLHTSVSITCCWAAQTCLLPLHCHDIKTWVAAIVARAMPVGNCTYINAATLHHYGSSGTRSNSISALCQACCLCCCPHRTASPATTTATSKPYLRLEAAPYAVQTALMWFGAY